ncbi:MAG: S41 family peptidase [Candidatus Saccharimonadales bacterium]
MPEEQQQHTLKSPMRNRRQRTFSKSFLFLTIAATALIGFVAGTRSNDIIAAIGPVFGIKVHTGTLDLSSVQTTYQKLAANYDGELDTQKLVEGASRGLVEAAGDPYTVYMDAKEAADFNNDLSGNIGGGIGAEIGLREEKPTIIRVLKDNPAEKAGLAAGDQIVAVNDQTAVGQTVDKVVGNVRGEAGTTVKISVLRSGVPKEFTVTRSVINNPSVDSKVENGIGTLTISRFDSQTGALARKAAQQFKDQGVKSVILDLRGNGGGYLGAAQDVAGLWLDEKVVVSERTGGRTTEELKTGKDALLAGIQTVVLVNGGTASASEIVAGALQDYGVATLLGEKTFGKGSVQQVLDLGAGTVLKVTIAKWYTPKGNNINKEGIEPDQTVVLGQADASSGNDPQLQAALKLLGE